MYAGEVLQSVFLLWGSDIPFKSGNKPWAYISKSFLVRLFLEEPVIMKGGGGGFAFQNGLGLPVKTAYSLS